MVIGHVNQDRVLQLIHRMMLFQEVRNILAKEDTDCSKLTDSPALERLAKNCCTVHESIALTDHHFRVSLFDRV